MFYYQATPSPALYFAPNSSPPLEYCLEGKMVLEWCEHIMYHLWPLYLTGHRALATDTFMQAYLGAFSANWFTRFWFPSAWKERRQVNSPRMEGGTEPGMKFTRGDDGTVFWQLIRNIEGKKAWTRNHIRTQWWASPGISKLQLSHLSKGDKGSSCPAHLVFMRNENAWSA